MTGGGGSSGSALTVMRFNQHTFPEWVRLFVPPNINRPTTVAHPKPPYFGHGDVVTQTGTLNKMLNIYKREEQLASNGGMRGCLRCVCMV
jgi:hypothetical protein